MKPSLKRLLQDWLPPAALRAGRSAVDLVRPASFEFVGRQWPASPGEAGWASEGVAEARERSWRRFVDSLASKEPMGIGADDLARPYHLDLAVQSLHTTFAYGLALAGRRRERISVLDWGGELGTYFHVARKLLPGVELDWHCVDLPLVVALGRKLNPDVTFHDDESWTKEVYDFVFSSSSLQYLPDWKPTVRVLAGRAKEWLYITRMPFVRDEPSFVALQRVREYGTEVHGWVLNRDEFVGEVEQEGFELVQSFINHRGPRIKGAPEQNVYMGFLFRRARKVGTASDPHGNRTSDSVDSAS